MNIGERIGNNSLALYNELNGRVEVAVILINNIKERLMDEMGRINWFKPRDKTV
jgi:hypothetical protein